MRDLETLSRASAAAIGRALAAGETTAVALAEQLLGRATAPEAENVYIHLTADRAMAEAKAADVRLQAGRPASALDGVPLVWKDLVDLAGTPTTAGSETRRDAPPATRDARIAASVAAAGMVCLGKTNLTEFAYSGIGLNPHYGTPRNPHSSDAARIPGGSSSGTGVAVAAHLAPCGIGTDTGGSVRLPAAFNGVVGYKTSEGRIDKDGVYPLSLTLDTVGPLGQTVEDCVLVDAALRGVTPTIARRPVSDAEIFVPESVALDDLDDAVAEAFEASLARLQDAGARIERGPFAPFQEIIDLTAAHGTLASVEAYALHHALVDGPQVGDVDARVVARIMGGKSMTAFSYHTILETRTRLIAEANAIVGDRLVAMPTAAMTAPKIDDLEGDVSAFNTANLKALRNTNLGNMLNLCGLAIPNGADAAGLPTSFLLSSVGDSDDRLLGFGLDAEAIIRGG